MFKTVTTKSLYDKRWMMLAWSLGVLVLVVFVVLLFPDFGKNNQISEQLQKLPESLQAISGSFDINTIEKYLDSQVFFNNLTFLFVILGIGFGVNALATEEDKGTLERVLATPVGKVRFFAEKFAVGAIIFAVVCVVAGIGVIVGTALVNEHVSIVRVVQACINLWIFTLVFGTLALAVGAITGRKNLSIAIPTALVVAMYILYTFAQSVKWLKGWDKLTINYYYADSHVVVKGINFGDLLVMVAVIAILFVAGIVVFKNRDIND